MREEEEEEKTHHRTTEHLTRKMLLLFFLQIICHCYADSVTPTKSLNDEREYEAFTLANGLSVLIVSDSKVRECRVDVVELFQFPRSRLTRRLLRWTLQQARLIILWQFLDSRTFLSTW